MSNYRPKSTSNMSDITALLKDSSHAKKSVQFTAELEDNFNTSKVGLTPSVNRLAPRYKMPEERSTQAQCVAPPSSITRPNYEGRCLMID